jgi:hypothetical protein
MMEPYAVNFGTYLQHNLIFTKTQNFNPWSLNFDHVLFDASHLANTSTNYDSRVSDRELKFCGAISRWAIFFISTLFVLHQYYKALPNNWGSQYYPFGVFVKISLFFVFYHFLVFTHFVSTRTCMKSNKLFSLTISHLYWIDLLIIIVYMLF